MTQNASISKLYLFSKDTDATEVVRGFKYQELKTLEIWLSNKVNGIEENIYCDYEEDIFQRDLKDFKATFRQIKLYSSRNFSFSSIEIIKAINHFFMLFVKGDYLGDSTLFIFETNTLATIQRGDDDSNLLLDWVENQEQLPDEMVERCLRKTKSIVNEYVDTQIKNHDSKIDPKQVIEAKQTFDELPEEIWILFIKSIRWVFKGISTDEALESSIENCKTLIKQLSFPIAIEEHAIVFDTLRGIVSDKTIASEPANRMISNELMDFALLNLGNHDDKNYIETFNIWKEVTKLEYFKIGEFYQVLFAAKYSRRKNYLKKHSELWMNLLDQYIVINRDLPRFRRAAIYEYIWLILRPNIKSMPKNSLDGFEKLVIEYFSDFDSYEDYDSIDDALNLLSIVATHQRLKLANIEDDLILEWFNRLEVHVSRCKENAPDKNHLCNLLEIEGFLFLNKDTFGIGDKNAENANNSFESILTELSEAPLYAVSQLGRRLDAIIGLKASHGLKGLESMEKFSEKLIPFILERDSNFSLAKRHLSLASKYLKSKDSSGLLKALDLFHKAKELYFEESTFEGFVLAIMNISQLYASIGMNLAAKYYSLSAIWFCAENNNPELYKRISDSYGLLFYSDFKQGSWMTAIADFEDYIKARTELNPSEFDPTVDEILQKTLIEESFLLATMPKISNQLIGYIDFEKSRMGQFYSEYLKENVEFIEGELLKINLKEIVSGKLNNPPINDLGKTREIAWKCFGCLWIVEIENLYINNSIGEEYAALIQIIQSDIALNEIDFHLTKGTVRVCIEIEDSIKVPEQFPSNDEYAWNVYLPNLKSKEPEDKNMHYALITTSFKIILNEISLLPEPVFNERFEKLFNEQLANKTLTINAYQREYRTIYSNERFDASMRSSFNPEIIDIKRYESDTLHWPNQISEFYNHHSSIRNIENRIRISTKSIHLSLERLNKSDEFKVRISDYRLKGYLDWQILFALFTNIMNIKASNILRQNGKKYNSDKDWIDDLQKTISELKKLDESETYTEIPLSELFGEELDIYLSQLPVFVLKSFGLENKSRFPNSMAIRELLTERFNFAIDDVPDSSPFVWV